MMNVLKVPVSYLIVDSPKGIRGHIYILSLSVLMIFILLFSFVIYTIFSEKNAYGDHIDVRKFAVLNESAELIGVLLV
jgi:transposase